LPLADAREPSGEHDVRDGPRQSGELRDVLGIHVRGLRGSDHQPVRGDELTEYARHIGCALPDRAADRDETNELHPRDEPGQLLVRFLLELVGIERIPERLVEVVLDTIAPRLEIGDERIVTAWIAAELGAERVIRASDPLLTSAPPGVAVGTAIVVVPSA
jgi:hypothetical protein